MKVIKMSRILISDEEVKELLDQEYRDRKREGECRRRTNTDMALLV